GENDTEEFRVDSVAPNTTKTYLGPYYIDPETGYEYIDNVSRINLTAIDGGAICHVDRTKTYYRYTRVNDMMCREKELCEQRHVHEEINEMYTEPFGIPEESCHLIEYYSVDGLGNTEEVKHQCIFVDHTPPVTTKEYEGPQYPYPITNETQNPYWISNKTEILVNATDQMPHPSGVNGTYFNDVYLEDEADWHYCQSDCDTWDQDARFGLPTAPEPYNPKGYNFSGLKESCHILEYYSMDNVNKTEEVNWQCVFVDNTAPNPNKQVGVPKSPMSEINKLNGKDYGYPELDPNGMDICSESDDKCWDITMSAPINLACEDRLPHPSGATDVCFNVDWDNTSLTEQYCEGKGTINDEGYCCVEEGTSDFVFGETTYHKLEYYCIDNVGNIGEPDIEYFKVAETGFNITLNKKWNLISVPVTLLDDSIEEVFAPIADK
ncbi:MAG: hypothetical protein KAQ92_05450, partial [Candidatus Aenigmarchaeota archaeon]|nr:hypothetical protein [Candidatus Aenigmarchaeota archaeon]